MYVFAAATELLSRAIPSSEVAAMAIDASHEITRTRANSRPIMISMSTAVKVSELEDGQDLLRAALLTLIWLTCSMVGERMRQKGAVYPPRSVLLTTMQYDQHARCRFNVISIVVKWAQLSLCLYIHHLATSSLLIIIPKVTASR